MSCKYVVVIPDGMGDRPIESLGRKTPLEAAFTPNMDYFSRHGLAGLSQNIPQGFIPGTDIGCMSVFGYDPKRYFTGRGPLEAAELGIKLKKNELAFRCNLVTMEGETLKDFCSDHISTAEAGILLKFLEKNIKTSLKKIVKFYAGEGTGYRNLMIFKEGSKKVKQSHCTPPHDIMGKKYQRFMPKGQGSEILVELMEESKRLFENHPVNQKRRREKKGEASMIWLWGQGASPNFLSYRKKYGLKGAVITAVDLVKGIAIHAGLQVISVPGVTGYFDTNYSGKARYALRALKKNDLAVIHIESTDEAGHMGDARLKIKAIQDVDRLVLGTLREGLEAFSHYKLMVLPDHYTCVNTRTHAGDAVPFFIYDSSKILKGPEKFCEKTAGASGFSVPQGHQMMNFFIRGNMN